jgi:stress-induced morphogen
LLRGCGRRLRPNGIKRHLAWRRYTVGVALETLQRFAAARLHAGTMRHEIRTAGLADRGDLFGRRLLGGRFAKPAAEHDASQNKKRQNAAMPNDHRHPPAIVCTTSPDPHPVRCALYCRIASALRRRPSLLIQCGGESANDGGAGMAMAASDIERLIRASIPDASVTIRDLAGDGDHYAATVIAESFRGKTRVQQHKIVYDALKGEMGGKLHALALQTGTPER